MADLTDTTQDLVAEQPDPFEPLTNVDRRTYCMSWRTAVKLFDDAAGNPTPWDLGTLREIQRRVEDEYTASWARRQAIWELILPAQDGDKPWDGFSDEQRRAQQERRERSDGLGMLHQHLQRRIQAAEAQRSIATALGSSLVEQDGSGGEPPILDLLQQVLDKRPISIEKWAADHHFGRSMVFDWKAAGGKPVPGKVSHHKSDAITEAIKQDAMNLGLPME